MKKYNSNNEIKLIFDNISVKFIEAKIDYLSPSFENRDLIFDFFKIHFVLDGEVDLFIYNKTFHLNKGSFFIVPSKTSAYYIKNSTRSFKRCWCSFDLNYPKRFLHFNKNVVCTTGTASDIEPIFKTLISHNKMNSINDVLNTKAGLLNLLSYFFSSFDINEFLHKKQDETYNILNDYINEHINEPILVNDLANLVHFEPSYFTRIFKKYFFDSPNKYINNLKIEKCAKQLTEYPLLSIEEIALDAGFSDYRYFSRLFKNRYGLSPTEYRNSSQKCPH